MPREHSGGSPPVPPADAGASPLAAIFFDLGTRDGRRAVEVRAARPLGNGFYASPRATLYSCAYGTQEERIAALGRARLFCERSGLVLVHQGACPGRRSAWQ